MEETNGTDEADVFAWSGFNAVFTLFLLGIIAVAFGAAMIGILWPSGSEDGSVGGVVVGALVAFAGSVCLLIGAVACGVRLGHKP